MTKSVQYLGITVHSAGKLNVLHSIQQKHAVLHGNSH
jgi:hypothetical protein